jgi:hypothetical protein
MKNLLFILLLFPFISYAQVDTSTLKTNRISFKKSIFSRDLESINQDFENAKKFQKILDSNKEVKTEYLLAVYHMQKGGRELGKSLIGIGLFGVLGSVAASNEDESLGIVAVGALGYSLYCDISSIVHMYKANFHVRNAYKLAGLPLPGSRRK